MTLLLATQKGASPFLALNDSNNNDLVRADKSEQADVDVDKIFKIISGPAVAKTTENTPYPCSQHRKHDEQILLGRKPSSLLMGDSNHGASSSPHKNPLESSESVAGLENTCPKSVLSHGKASKGFRRANSTGSLQVTKLQPSRLDTESSHGKATRRGRRAKAAEEGACVDPSSLNRASSHGKPIKGLRRVKSSGSLQVADLEPSSLDRTSSRGKATRRTRRARSSEEGVHLDSGSIIRTSSHGKPTKGVRRVKSSGSLQVAGLEPSSLDRTFSQEKATKGVRRVKTSEGTGAQDPASSLKRSSSQTGGDSKGRRGAHSRAKSPFRRLNSCEGTEGVLCQSGDDSKERRRSRSKAKLPLRRVKTSGGTEELSSSQRKLTEPGSSNGAKSQVRRADSRGERHVQEKPHEAMSQSSPGQNARRRARRLENRGDRAHRDGMSESSRRREPKVSREPRISRRSRTKSPALRCLEIQNHQLAQAVESHDATMSAPEQDDEQEQQPNGEKDLAMEDGPKAAPAVVSTLLPPAKIVAGLAVAASAFTAATTAGQTALNAASSAGQTATVAATQSATSMASKSAMAGYNVASSTANTAFRVARDVATAAVATTTSTATAFRGGRTSLARPLNGTTEYVEVSSSDILLEAKAS